jgi:hypothetical protein
MRLIILECRLSGYNLLLLSLRVRVLQEPGGRISGKVLYSGRDESSCRSRSGSDIEQVEERAFARVSDESASYSAVVSRASLAFICHGKPALMLSRDQR